eukprot:GHVN01053444.1.p1 GENE.GHVN01053444.1~~GHVN01053444.1.p1  ORF type:complete len:847 (+),score=140.02 GHVN01053444.1:1193-3733(+)
MKFGRRLEAEANPQYRLYYIAYKDLKRAIRIITGSSQEPAHTIKEVASNFGNIKALAGSIYRPSEARFQDLLNHECEKINNFSSITVSAISDRLKSAVKGLQQSPSAERIEQIVKNVDECADDTVFLDQYQKLNYIGFTKITKKYDKHNKSVSSRWYLARLVNEAFMNIDFDRLIAILSVCYDIINEIKGVECGLSSVDGPQTPPQGSAINTKYLIKPDEALRVKVMLMKHVPLCNIGGHRVDRQRVVEETLDPLKKLSAPITSDKQQMPTGGCVYFDNDKFDTYSSLLIKERSQHPPTSFFRVRWDGANEGDQDLPLYIERIGPIFKDGVDAPSSPLASDEAHTGTELPDTTTLSGRRSKVKQRHIGRLFDLSMTANDLRAQERVMSRASGGGETIDLSSLEWAVQTAASKDLHPVLQTWYRRSTFRSRDGALHANLDEDLKFVSEYPTTSHNSDLWVTGRTQALATDKVKSFTFAVLDVSLRKGASLRFLTEITGLTSVVEVFGFSTFAHGVASLYPNNVDVKPHWFKYIQEVDEAVEAEKNGASEKISGEESDDDDGKDRASAALHSRVAKRTSHDPIQVSLDIIKRNPGDNLAAEGHGMFQDYASPPSMFGPSGRQDNIASPNLDSGWAMRRQPTSTSLAEPLLPDDVVARNGRRMIHSLQQERDEVPLPARSASTLGLGSARFSRRCPGMSMLPRFPWGRPRNGRRTSIQAVHSGAVRVEPKAFFANERTLLQWMNIAVLISTIGITLLNFGTPISRVGGLILSPIAIFFLVYSFNVYLNRARKLENKDVMGYHDRIGPTILVVSLVFALSTIICLNIWENLATTDSDIGGGSSTSTGYPD